MHLYYVGYEKVEGHYCPSPDLSEHDVDPETCAEICDNNEICTAFDINHNTNGCYLKEACPTLSATAGTDSYQPISKLSH